MLHHLWSWADAQSRNGHAAGVTKKWVDRYVHRDGFADSMCAVGWLVMDDTGLTIPNFERHNGKPAKDRALAGERQRLKRSNVTQEVKDLSREERDTSVTREEKRREEIDQEHLSSKPDEGVPAPKRKVDQTPYQEILNRYQTICSGIFLGAEVLNDKRKRNIKRTYDLKVRERYPFHDLEFWDKYLKRCITNKHWCGENSTGWKAGLEFVTREENVLKVLGV